MNYTPEQLKPCNPIVSIGDYDVELSVVTLNHTVKYKENFGDVTELYNVIKDDAEKLVDIVWVLVVNKHLFNNDFKTFDKKFRTSKKLADVANKVYLAFDDCVTKSMPLVLNSKREKEINELRNAGKNIIPCYAKYFDQLAKRYGLSINDFYELNLRQITAMIKTINSESYGELEVQAALAGRKLKPKIEFKQVSEDEEKEQDAHAVSALAELEENYQRLKDEKNAKR